ncbi:hypothetical protein B296_00039080 [Ensete ventricosum]|uniref:Uncharacterized protein n=1 Tax=Ensete ventricosum TaxID=4639 RepID=A0A426X7M7_ENSVE|nr:hypothetical protein B296_00039080 [Ensete ventricosum]
MLAWGCAALAVGRQRGGAASYGQPPCKDDHPRPGRLQWAIGCDQGPLQGGDRPRPKPLVGAAVSMHGYPQAWLAPAGAVPAGVGSARDQVIRGGCPLRGRKGQPQGLGCHL